MPSTPLSGCLHHDHLWNCRCLHCRRDRFGKGLSFSAGKRWHLDTSTTQLACLSMVFLGCILQAIDQTLRTPHTQCLRSRMHGWTPISNHRNQQTSNQDRPDNLACRLTFLSTCLNPHSSCCQCLCSACTKDLWNHRVWKCDIDIPQVRKVCSINTRRRCHNSEFMWMRVTMCANTVYVCDSARARVCVCV